MKKKILFIVTEDWYFISHRLELAKYLIYKGFDVSVCCKDTGNLKEIKKYNISHYHLDSKRKSLSLIQFLKELIILFKVAYKLKPQIVHLISMRPIIIGMVLSLFIKSKFCATFTGMGFIFIKRGFKGFVFRKLIIIFLKVITIFKNIFFIVQNKDDEFFFKKKINIKNKFLKIIRGSGIDIKNYKYTPEIINKNIRLAYAGRILEDKGILWLIESFYKAKIQYPNLKLYIAGPLDKKNPSSLSKGCFKKLTKNKDIYYLGNVKNVKKFWQDANIAILLSKREGLPLSLLEAAAIGRPIISSDVPGSREIAIDGYNSINIKPGNILECSEAILKLTKNKTLRKKYGKNSRKLVEGDMALDKVCAQYLSLYKQLI